jgi:cytochrome c-type biogenesis protein
LASIESLSPVAIFGAGLLSFASPCVLPLIPVYLGTLLGTSLGEANTRRALAVAGAFSAGLSVVFVTLGALASTLGGVLVAYKTPVSLVSGVLMLLFGLRAVGVLRLRSLDRDARPMLARVRVASNLSSAFVFGAAFALGWSPCVGPVLASVLTFAAANATSPWHGAGYLAVYAAGFSAPLFGIAAAASYAPRWLQRTRRALPRLERLTGAALLLVGLWMVVGAVRQFVAIDTSAAVATERPAPSKPTLACETSSDQGSCGLPHLAAGTHPAPRVSGARLLEFSSQHCPACQRMRPTVDRLVRACELDSLVMHVDVSTSGGQSLAHRHAVRATPTFVLVDESGRERARILGETSANDIAAAVEKAFGISCAPG